MFEVVSKQSLAFRGPVPRAIAAHQLLLAPL